MKKEDKIRLVDRIKSHPRIKKMVVWLISPHQRPKPRCWVRLMLNPFIHRRGRNTVIRRWRSRIDVFPWHRFDIGRDSTIEDFSVINNGAGDVIIGDGVRIGIGTVIIGPACIGNGAATGQHVFIAGFNHGFSEGDKNTRHQPLDIRGVELGEDVLVGANSVVLAGVRIGKRSLIGAGSVVSKDIPPFCLAVGNPARIIKRYNHQTKQWEKV
jgi:acetyltransferase-like isoleucine patch superfamily enzyme